MKVKFYPNRKDNDGYAAEFVLKDGTENISCFMVAQEQLEDTGTRKFNWAEPKAWIKLSSLDAASLLRVVENNDSANIYYQNEKGWVRCEGNMVNNGVVIKISRSIDGVETNNSINLGVSETKLLSVFLREAITRTFDYRFVRKDTQELVTTAADNNQPF